MVNTYSGLILPFLVTRSGVPLMRQFEQPDELIEAARIDGAGERRLRQGDHRTRPGPGHPDPHLLSPATSCGRWWWPSPRTSTPCRWPWPRTRSARNATRYGLLLAGSVVVILPVVVLFVALQRYFVEGIATTGIK